MTHLDPKALEAAATAIFLSEYGPKFDFDFPDNRSMRDRATRSAEAAISAYLAALPQAEPVGFIPQTDLDRLARGDRVDCRIYRERTGSRFVAPLFASPTPAVSLPDVIEACANAAWHAVWNCAAEYVGTALRDEFADRVAASIRALSSEPHHG